MLADFLSSFTLGLLTPLGAVCVLPLFPGFLAYLANKVSKDNKKSIFIVFGLLITAGVVLFMSLLGIIFTTILKTSLTKVVNVVSPIAFGILIVLSLLLIFNVDFSKYLPKAQAPILSNSYLNALVYGFLFGAIVLPCNPAFIAIMFTKTIATSAASFIVNIINFIFFGLGMAAPLLLFSVISAAASTTIIKYLTKYKREINIVAGVIMLVISLYYIIFVFRILG